MSVILSLHMLTSDFFFFSFSVFVSLCVCTLLLHRKLRCALVTVSLTSASFQLSGRDNLYLVCVCVWVSVCVRDERLLRRPFYPLRCHWSLQLSLVFLVLHIPPPPLSPPLLEVTTKTCITIRLNGNLRWSHQLQAPVSQSPHRSAGVGYPHKSSLAKKWRD